VNDSELGNVADRLFKAFEEHDFDTVRELCDPGARFWSSVAGRESSVEQLLGYLPAVRERIGAHRYSDVRRLVAPDGFVEQHRVTSTRPDGTALDMEVCVVVRTDEEGKIVRLDEYVAAPVDL
jgi:ketosteroid isomerase-like protein